MVGTERFLTRCFLEFDSWCDVSDHCVGPSTIIMSAAIASQVATPPGHHLIHDLVLIADTAVRVFPSPRPGLALEARRKGIDPWLVHRTRGFCIPNQYCQNIESGTRNEVQYT